MTTKHARRGDQASNQGEFGVTTKHARRGAMVHFALTSK
jgi:hypothetical protein